MQIENMGIPSANLPSHIKTTNFMQKDRPGKVENDVVSINNCITTDKSEELTIKKDILKNSTQMTTNQERLFWVLKTEVFDKYQNPSKERDDNLLFYLARDASGSEDMIPYKKDLFSEESCYTAGGKSYSFDELGKKIDEYKVIYPRIRKMASPPPNRQTVFYRWVPTQYKEAECKDNKIDFAEMFSGRKYDNGIIYVASDSKSSSGYGNTLETYKISKDTLFLDATLGSENLEQLYEEYGLDKNFYYSPLALYKKAGIEMGVDNIERGWYILFSPEIIESVS